MSVVRCVDLPAPLGSGYLDGADGEPEVPASAGRTEEGERMEREAMAIRQQDCDVQSTQAGALSERDQQILTFERGWWKYTGAKEQAIRDLFDMSATTYYQILNATIDTPEALAFDPMLVKRLRRLRFSRQRARAHRRIGAAF